MNYELRFIIPLLLFIALSVTAVPFDAAAQGGLVPCGTQTHPKGQQDARGNDISGQVSNPCQPCHIFSLIQNVFNFIWRDLALPLAILMFAIGGFMMIIPGVGGEKSVPMYQKGKKVLTNAVIGIVIIFLAWLTIDTIIKALGGKMAARANVVTVTQFGPWNKIKCEPK